MINGKIYSIRTLTNENLIYIGSTKEPRLSARLSKHKYPILYFNLFFLMRLEDAFSKK